MHVFHVEYLFMNDGDETSFRVVIPTTTRVRISICDDNKTVSFVQAINTVLMYAGCLLGCSVGRRWSRAKTEDTQTHTIRTVCVYLLPNHVKNTYR